VRLLVLFTGNLSRCTVKVCKKKNKIKKGKERKKKKEKKEKKRKKKEKKERTDYFLKQTMLNTTRTNQFQKLLLVEPWYRRHYNTNVYHKGQ
jgi:hypothetical protein